MHIPIFRPCGEKNDFAVSLLKKHLLHGDHATATPIVVGCPVVAGSPKGRKAERAVAHLETNQPRSLIGKTDPAVRAFSVEKTADFEKAIAEVRA